MAVEAKYTIVGRYMDGPSVNAYHLLASDGYQRRFTKEQVAYLVGKGDITNCKGQIYKDEVLLRGVGINLSDLPVVDEKTGTLKNTESLGKIARGSTNEDAMTQFMIVKRISDGRNIIGYVLRNAGGIEKTVRRQDVIQLAMDKRIGNARVQKDGDKVLLRGHGISLDSLPTQVVEAKRA